LRALTEFIEEDRGGFAILVAPDRTVAFVLARQDLRRLADGAIRSSSFSSGCAKACSSGVRTA